MNSFRPYFSYVFFSRLSEPEIKTVCFDVSVLFWCFGFNMDRITLYMDCLDRTYILAAATAYAKFLCGLRDGESAFERHHVDGLDRTVLGTCPAAGTVHIDYTYILIEHHVSWLSTVFLICGKRTYGTGGTYLTAKVAVIVAVAVIKFHDRLHDAPQSVFHTGGFEYM